MVTVQCRTVGPGLRPGPRVWDTCCPGHVAQLTPFLQGESEGRPCQGLDPGDPVGCPFSLLRWGLTSTRWDGPHERNGERRAISPWGSPSGPWLSLSLSSFKGWEKSRLPHGVVPDLILVLPTRVTRQRRWSLNRCRVLVGVKPLTLEDPRPSLTLRCPRRILDTDETECERTEDTRVSSHVGTVGTLNVRPHSSSPSSLSLNPWLTKSASVKSLFLLLVS